LGFKPSRRDQETWSEGRGVGGRLPHRLAMAVALCLPEPPSPGPYQWQGTGLGALGASPVPLAQQCCGARPCLSACGREGRREAWRSSPSSMRQNPTGSSSTPTAAIGTWGRSPPRQPMVRANPTCLPKPAVRAGGTQGGGWSSRGRASQGSSLGAAKEGSYRLTR